MARPTKTAAADKAAALTNPNTTNEPAPIASEAKEPKKFQANDLISCRSLTQGELLLPGKKSEILYRWSAYGDVTNVEYQDLYALKASRSDYILKPLFVIEDEELLNQPLWSDLKAIYEKLYSNEDMDKFLALPLAQFKRALLAAPAGYRQALCIQAATQIANGSFDSMNKIKAIDEVCGTDLKSIFA